MKELYRATANDLFLKVAKALEKINK